MPEILHLNLHREFFDAIARKQKRIEYRKRSPYWRKRLENRKYDPAMAMRRTHRKCWWNFACQHDPSGTSVSAVHLFTFAPSLDQFGNRTIAARFGMVCTVWNA
jgi:hypothetical protein